MQNTTQKNKQQADKIVKDAMKYVIKYVNNIRMDLPKESEIKENEIDSILYDIGKVKRFFKIQNDYWETIQRLQEEVSYNLTLQEYKYINEQIEAEMSTEIFKSDMGLKIFSYVN